MNEDRLAEAKLRDAEALYHSLVDNLPQSIFRKDVNGRFTFASQRCCHDLRKPLEAIIGKTDFEIFPSELAEKYRSDDRRIMETGQVFETVEEHQTIGGKKLYVQVVKTRLHDAEGRIIGVQGIYWDITAKKEAEAALAAEQAKAHRLLLNILPASIAERLQAGETTIAEAFPDVTVLFADLVGFTELAALISAKELVTLLNRIFCIFDGLVEDLHLEKIKTIGDAYMVVGGVPERRDDHAEAVAEMALGIQRELLRFNLEQAADFRARIGIHTGPVIAGIIGRKKFSYDLWGDTVNVASRMESHGVVGGIQVSSETHERLRDRYLFEERGPVVVKSKGAMKAYVLLGRK